MTDADQLVVYLLLFRLELHFVWERLPFAAAAYSEMFAERLKPMLGRFYHRLDKALHIVFLFLRNFHIHNVSRDCKFHEYYSAVDMGERTAFCRHGLDCDIFQYDFLFFLCHYFNLRF